MHIRAPFFLLALLACTVPLSSHAAASAKRPNILYIFSDDHAYQAISAYGDPRKLLDTPNIDRIAKEGMRFNRCLVPNSICGPSRATVLTGKYSHLNGFPNNSNSRFDGSQTTFPKLLQAAGYQTAIIGKWHLESDPTGFDHWEVLPGQGVYYNPPMIKDGQKIVEEGYVTDIITDRSIEWLKQRDKSKPFLLMTHHKAPHREWYPALRYLDFDHDRQYAEPPTLFDDYANRGLAVRDQDMTIEKTMNDKDLKFTSDPRMTPEQRKAWDAYYVPRNEAFKKANLQGRDLTRWKYNRYMHDYLATIKAVDESVGRLLKYLDDAGLADNTIVVYTSDQGFYLGEHGWFDKRWIFEESIRTPFLMRWPGVIKPGGVNDNLVSTVDFAETFLDAAGLPIPAEMQGHSLLPVLEGHTPADWRKSFYYHYYEYPVPHHVRPHYGVVTDRYKLVHFYTPDVNYWELYDRLKDPLELRSVYNQPEYQVVQQDLAKELQRLRVELKVPETVPPEYYGNVKKGAALNRKPLNAFVLDYDFTQNTGAHITDASGKNNAGAAKGTLSVDARAGHKAQRFDGHAWIEVANNKTMDPSGIPWSVEVVAKPEQPTGVLLARGGGSQGYSLYLADGGKPAFLVRSSGRATQVMADKPITGQWTHLAGVITADHKVRLYVNGALAGETSLTDYIGNDPSDSLQIGADTGSQVGDYSEDLKLTGLVERVRLYSGERTAEEVAKDAAGQAP